MLGVSFLLFSGNLFPHFSLTMLQLSVLTPGCIHLAGIYFSCLNIFSIFLDFLPSLSQHYLNSPRNFTMTIFTFFTCANDSYLTCINVYLGLVFQSNNRVPDCSYTSFPMSTRIIRVQPLVLHLCIGRLLHLQTFTFAHWQTFASADLHFSTFLNTYFLWEMWPIHVIAKV